MTPFEKMSLVIAAGTFVVQAIRLWRERRGVVIDEGIGTGKDDKLDNERDDEEGKEE